MFRFLFVVVLALVSVACGGSYEGESPQDASGLTFDDQTPEWQREAATRAYEDLQAETGASPEFRVLLVHYGDREWPLALTWGSDGVPELWVNTFLPIDETEFEAEAKRLMGYVFHG